MTAKEKTSIARFLDLAGDYLKDGYARDGLEYNFSDDEDQKEPVPSPGDLSGLPLAYQVDEEEVPGDAQENSVFPALEDIAAEIRTCKACGLCRTRKQAVPGEGASRPLVMVIGEGPGADEDATGRPFVGRAGQLLDRMLASIGLFREKNCYIANMVKCRPPGNRNPEAEEIAACLPFLEKQIAIQKPAIILCAGKVSAQNILKTNKSISSLRGNFSEYQNSEIPVLCTFHPSALLRDESLKRPAWEDLKLLRSRLITLDAGYKAQSGGEA